MLQIKALRGEPIDAAAQAILQRPDAGKRFGVPLAMIYLANGQPDRCANICLQALRENPNKLDFRVPLAQAYEAMGQRDKCLEEWKQVITGRPESLPPYQRLASLLLAQIIGEEVAAEGKGETGSRKIDDLLRRWGGRSDEVEAVDLTVGVLAKIRGERRRATPQRYLLRIGLPLAAAAAIIFTATTTTWFAPPPQPICRVAIGPSSRTMTRAAPETGSTDVVSFARPTEALAASPTVPSVGFATIGVEPIGAGLEESAPL
jgi:hypothetical protein